MVGFCILNAILGGQTLSSVSGGSLSWRYVQCRLLGPRLMTDPLISVGIVIIVIISLLVRNTTHYLTLAVKPRHVDLFLWVQGAQLVRCGPKFSVLHVHNVYRYERLAWIPVLVVYVVALGIGGKHLINPSPAEPSSASAILSFASTIAGFVITYSPLASDFTTYFKPDVSACVYFLQPFQPSILSI